MRVRHAAHQRDLTCRERDVGLPARFRRELCCGFQWGHKLEDALELCCAQRLAALVVMMGDCASDLLTRSESAYEVEGQRLHAALPTLNLCDHARRGADLQPLALGEVER